jgi:two-component system, NarL family, response regulator LiaR
MDNTHRIREEHPIKLLIIDDHPMMREALAMAFAGEKDMAVVGEASDGIEGMKLAVERDPDVILMDLLMPGMDGLQAIDGIIASKPDARILVVTSLEDEDKILAAIQGGALGYFPKSAPRPFLLEAIHKVADGIPYLAAGIALKLFKGIRAMKAPSSARSAIDEPLTSRQGEILALLGEGRSDQEIGKTLHLEEATVRSHVHRILQRLGVENRSQAVAYANRIRKVDSPEP